MSAVGAAAAAQLSLADRRFRQDDDALQFQEGISLVRQGHGLDEMLLEGGLDRCLDLFHPPRQLADDQARFGIEQSAPCAGSGGVAGGGDLVEITVRQHAQHHSVFHVDMAAKGACQTDAIDMINECKDVAVLETLHAMLVLKGNPNTDHELNDLMAGPTKRRLDLLKGASSG